MTRLTQRNLKALREAKRSGDPDRLERVIEEVVEDQLERWARGKSGRYGLVEDCETRAGRERAEQLVQVAWNKLKEIAHEEVRDTIAEYEQAHGGPPQFEAKGNTVDRDAGASTQTRWQKIPGGYRQTESGRIYIGDKWICRRTRSELKHVIISIMKTLVHEVMGHWDRVGQRVPGSNEEQRKSKAEDVADDITDRHWEDLKDTERWDDFVADLEGEFEDRKPAQEAEIRRAVDSYLESLKD